MNRVHLRQRFTRHYWNACSENNFFLNLLWLQHLVSRFNYFILSLLKWLFAIYTLFQKLIVLHTLLDNSIFGFLFLLILLKLYKALAFTLVCINSKFYITASECNLASLLSDWKQLFFIFTVACLEKKLVYLLRSL